jgi:hypothetical protein
LYIMEVIISDISSHTNVGWSDVVVDLVSISLIRIQELQPHLHNMIGIDYQMRK